MLFAVGTLSTKPPHAPDDVHTHTISSVGLASSHHPVEIVVAVVLSNALQRFASACSAKQVITALRGKGGCLSSQCANASRHESQFAMTRTVTKHRMSGCDGFSNHVRLPWWSLIKPPQFQTPFFQPSDCLKFSALPAACPLSARAGKNSI